MTNEMPEAPKKRGRRPKQDPRKQITVRIPQSQYDRVAALLKAEGITITDVVEDALWVRLQSAKGEELATTEMRYLSTILPLSLQQLTLRFWAYILEEWGADLQDLEPGRQFFLSALQLQMTPERLQARLQRMAELYGRPTRLGTKHNESKGPRPPSPLERVMAARDAVRQL
jgi:hypothetical protein